MGSTMSMRPITSCDFVTRLSVCPSNGFPAYRDFTEQEVERLTEFIKTTQYSDLLKLSPFQRAYGVAGFLGETNNEQAFWLQMSSMWYEPDAFFNDAASVEKFLFEAEGQRSRVSPSDRPYFLATVAYVLAKSGKAAEAREWLAQAVEASDGSDFLKAYFPALEGCVDNIASAECQPEAEFRF